MYKYSSIAPTIQMATLLMKAGISEEDEVVTVVVEGVFEVVAVVAVVVVVVVVVVVDVVVVVVVVIVVVVVVVVVVVIIKVVLEIGTLGGSPVMVKLICLCLCHYTPPEGEIICVGLEEYFFTHPM